MRDIKLCNFALRDAWKYTQAKWTENFPNKPQPIITCTLRSLAEQKALFAQGRLFLAEINKLRKIAGLGSIKIEEAKSIVTYADAGQSKHNPDKSGLSKAFDIGFVNLSSGKNHTLVWDVVNFKEFYKILSAKYPEIVWGGNWTKFKDYPHFEVK
jgi:peptidoglycan L-alanyl-D-glutamate endopeptidase CwlK